MWPFKKKKPRKRAFQASALTRLTADWAMQPTSADADIIPSLKALRARSRDLSQNNDYAKRFLNMLKSNVIGAGGITLQNKAKDTNGKYDTQANGKIEKAWKQWKEKGICTMCGSVSFAGLQHLLVESLARDGEVLIQKVRQGAWGYSLHVLEADYLDEDFNDSRRRIKGGVQHDQWGRPVAYYVFKSHPGEADGTVTRRHFKRLPASEVFHLFLKERAGQTRGVPWLATPAYRLKQLGGIEEAELVASRVSAAKMGFFTSPDGDGFSGDGEEAETGATITNAEPGTFEQLPDGTDFTPWDPKHPNGAFEAFSKSILRGIASGLNVSYVGLSNNLEGVSYSSIRQGELADRDAWRLMQRWLIENFIDPVFQEWLKSALFSNNLNLPLRKIDKFNQPHWLARGWNWVDPQKEISANIEAVKAGFKTLTDVVSEQGRDIEEVFDTLAREKELAESYGLNLPTLFGDQNGKNETGVTDPKSDD